MKQLIMMVLVVLASCTGEQTTEQSEKHSAHENESHVAKVPLNNAVKWKADDATKKNVAAMEQVLTSGTYAGAEKRMQLYASLQAKVDTLVSECRMTGPDHDGLHVWLEKVLKDLENLKDANNDYNEAHDALKTDMISFHQSFE